jgi:hypothetical protein
MTMTTVLGGVVAVVMVMVVVLVVVGLWVGGQWWCAPLRQQREF